LRSDFTVANNVPILQIEFENLVRPGRDRVTQRSVAKQRCECQLDAADTGGHIREALVSAALGRLSRLKIRTSVLRKTEAVVPWFHDRIEPRLAGQPDARRKGEERFFIWNRCNPLKGPDSDE
jgi:hypothetical protein